MGSSHEDWRMCVPVCIYVYECVRMPCICICLPSVGWSKGRKRVKKSEKERREGERGKRRDDWKMKESQGRKRDGVREVKCE